MDILGMTQQVEQHGVSKVDKDGTIHLKNGVTLVPEFSYTEGCDTCGYGSEVKVTWYVLNAKSE